jgi:glycosyltransferase involved in cell wall biosynthesis
MSYDKMGIKKNATNNKLSVINFSELDPSWNWLANEFNDPNLTWLHYSTLNVNVPNFFPKKELIRRLISANNALSSSRKQKSLLVSHGPRPTLYLSTLAKVLGNNVPHLSYSLNFTNLPTGVQHKLMVNAFKQPTKFVVYSNFEKKLYSEYLDIDENKIDMLHWGVHEPTIDNLALPIESGEYICAVGSQGRDYEVLFTAMRKLKNIKLILVATAECIQHLTVPENVKVHTNIPLEQAHNIIFHSKFMVLPLRDSQVPCGHVTIVSGMFFRKAILVTNSEGVHDYIHDNVTGKFFIPHDPQELSYKIEALWNNSNEIEQLGNTAYEFAKSHCTEKTVINYFQKFLTESQAY